MADIVTNTLQIGNNNLILRDADAQEKVSGLKEDLEETENELKSAINGYGILYCGDITSVKYNILTLDNVDIGDEIVYSFFIPQGSTGYLELLDSNNTRISFVGYGGTAAQDMTVSGKFNIPSNFYTARFVCTYTRTCHVNYLFKGYAYDAMKNTKWIIENKDFIGNLTTNLGYVDLSFPYTQSSGYQYYDITLFPGKYLVSNTSNSDLFFCDSSKQHILPIFRNTSNVLFTITEAQSTAIKYVEVYNGTVTVKSFENIVDIANGRKFYCGSGRELSTLKAGLEEAVKHPSATLYVDPGVYDLVEEFGTSFFDNLTATTGVHAGLKLGNGVHVIFSPNSKVVSNYTGNNQYAQSYYSPFNIEAGGFTIENLTLECSRCRYAVHDERDGGTELCRSEYIDCSFIIDNTNNAYWTQACCIGGGLGSNHYVRFYGCDFSASPLNHARAGIYYHLSNNLSNPDFKCIIDIQGNYLKTGTVMLDFTRSDASEKTKVIVANNSLLQVDGAQANGLYYGGNFTDANLDLMTWNNEIRQS